MKQAKEMVNGGAEAKINKIVKNVVSEKDKKIEKKVVDKII